MKKRLLIVMALSLVVLTGFAVTVYAETTPEEDVFVTEPVIATEEPVYTDAPDVSEEVTSPLPSDEPYSTDPFDTIPTDNTDTSSATATDSTGSTETTVMDTTAIVTTPVESTIPDEDSTYSDYVSPDPVYTPGDQNFKENDWQEIELDLESPPAPGKQSFAFIQNDTSKGNTDTTYVLIIGIVLIFLALAGVTFVIIPIPVILKTKSTQKVTTTNSKRPAPKRSSYEPKRTRSHTENRRTFNPDDYNDGF